MAASKRTKASGLLFFLPALAALSATSDFNSDGYDDPAIGTHFEDIGAISGAGAVSILLGSAGGLTEVGDQFWHQDTAGVLDTAEGGDQFGEDLAGVFDAGAVNLLPGSAAGLTAVGDQFWSEDSAGILATAENSDNFGKFRG